MKRPVRSLLAPVPQLAMRSANAAEHEEHPLWAKWKQASRIAGSEEASILVPVADLVRHPDVQSRVRIDDAPGGTVDKYAEEMKRLLAAGKDPAKEFPALRVFVVVGRLIVSRGFQRTLAAERAGALHLRAVFRQGSLKDAKWDAMGDNGTHGLPRSKEDLEQNLRDILLDPEWSRRSNVLIGDHLHVHDTTVLRHRRLLERELAGTSAAQSLEEPERRTGKDGKRRRLPQPRPAPAQGPRNLRDRDRPSPSQPAEAADKEAAARGYAQGYRAGLVWAASALGLSLGQDAPEAAIQAAIEDAGQRLKLLLRARARR